MATGMSHFDWDPDVGGPGLAPAMAATATFGTMAWVAWKMSPVLIMPAASLVLLIAGFSLARTRRHQVGVLVFLGFAAAILTNGVGLAALFDASR